MKKMLVALLLSIFISVMLITPALSVNIGDRVKLKKGYVIAVSKNLFDKATKMIYRKDYEAFQKMAATGLVGITKEGAEVYIENVHPFGGTAEVRLKGETEILWTNFEAVGYGTSR